MQIMHHRSPYSALLRRRSAVIPCNQMNLGFLCPNIPGHLNPMTALARHLQARNHEVVFLSSKTAAGLPFVPPPEKDHLKESMPEMSKLKGEDASSFTMRALMTEIEFILKTMPAMIRATEVDALLIDPARFYAELGAMQLGVPYIHVSNALHLDYTGSTPLCLYDWPHLTTPAALARNREGVARYVKRLQSCNAGIRAYAKSFELKIDWEEVKGCSAEWGVAAAANCRAMWPRPPMPITPTRAVAASSSF